MFNHCQYFQSADYGLTDSDLRVKATDTTNF